MNRTRVLVAALLFAVIVPGGGAQAVQSSCGGSWADPLPNDGCVIPFRGFPLTIHARVTSSLGVAATVVAWIEVEREQPGFVRIPIVACAAVRVGGTNCTQTIGSSGGLGSLPLGLRLQCRVLGLDYGIYSCSSGTP